jgi:hypothetical protein
MALCIAALDFHAAREINSIHDLRQVLVADRHYATNASDRSRGTIGVPRSRQSSPHQSRLLAASICVRNASKRLVTSASDPFTSTPRFQIAVARRSGPTRHR